MRQNNKYAFNDSYYKRSYRNAIEGNAAKNLAVEEDYEEELLEEEYELVEEPVVKERPKRIHQYEVQRAPKEKIKRSYQGSVITSVMLVLSMVFLFTVASTYIKKQSEINLLDKQIAAAKATLADVNEKNAALLNKLDTEVDRNYLYTVAVSQFGMQYPTENQVINYQTPDQGYVKQYGNIPMGN